jgi:Rps23 Pro-64 3,4-dihydroxylase Tpa1-like proline 4-hydroxylase
MRDQAMLSVYAAGSTGYTVHVDHDGLAYEMPRVLTAIMYLNPHWKPSYGGQLRLHVASTTASSTGAHPARGDLRASTSHHAPHASPTYEK